MTLRHDVMCYRYNLVVFFVVLSLSLAHSHICSLSTTIAKQVTELVADSQRMFGDMVSEMGLAASMSPETEYTLLAPLNSVFTSVFTTPQQQAFKYR